MRRTEKQKARTLIGAFSRGIGSETLNVRIYRDRLSCVCERELVERDGTSFTMVFPFSELNTLRTLLIADPYCARLRTEVEGLLGKVDRALRISDAKSDA